MAEGPFRFFRGTAHLFYEDLSKANTLPASPLTWICGDLHMENFGSYKGDNRLVYFDINDFDEAILAPATWELVRIIASIFTTLGTLHINQDEALNLAWLFLITYATTISKGRSRYIEPQTANGIVKTFLAKVSERKQKDLIAARTVKKNGKLMLLADGKRCFKIDKQLKADLAAFLNKWMENGENRKRYQVADVGFRIAGTGSIGLHRYVFLMQKADVPGKYLLMDMKQSLPSAIEPYSLIQQPIWQSEAERVVAIQERMQNISPALLSTGIFNNVSYVIKEMQPTADKIDFATLKRRYNDIEEVLRNMAMLTASAQLRSSGRQGSAPADELIEFGRDTAWMQSVIAYADAYARQVKNDYIDYVTAYKAGYFSDLS